MSSSASVTIPCSIAKLVSDSNAAVEFAKRGRANLTPNFRLVCVLQFDRLLNEELNFGPGARKISLKLLTSRVWALSSFVPWMLISAPAHFSSPDVRPVKRQTLPSLSESWNAPGVPARHPTTANPSFFCEGGGSWRDSPA